MKKEVSRLYTSLREEYLKVPTRMSLARYWMQGRTEFYPMRSIDKSNAHCCRKSLIQRVHRL